MTKSLVTFLLDGSGSMNSVKSFTLEAFNSYVDALRAADNIAFSLIRFASDDIEKLMFETPIKEVKALTDATYRCAGGTPLIEAAITTINALAAALPSKPDVSKIIVCIQTDGEENASGHEYTWDVLRALIAEKQKLGWEFNFLGAGIDAYQQGARMGVSTANTMSYDSSKMGTTREAFRDRGMAHASYSAGLSANTQISMSAKAASGDRFVPGPDTQLQGHHGHTNPLAVPAVPLAVPQGGLTVDLTVSSGPQPAPRRQNLTL